MTRDREDEEPNDFQARVLRAYTVLCLLREDWPGALIVCCGLGPQGAAVAMAANIAGALFLGIEPRHEALKLAGRAGAFDFLVNTLDEALRALKNEARKRQPISVGLLGDPLSIVQDLVERGVQPVLFTDLLPDLVDDLAPDRPLHTEVQLTAMDAHRRAMQQLRRQGSLLLEFAPALPGMHAEGAVSARALLDDAVQQRAWQLHTFTLLDAQALKRFDAEALAQLAPRDTLRRRWLGRAASIVQRQRPLRRSLWITAPEADRLAACTLPPHRLSS